MKYVLLLFIIVSNLSYAGERLAQTPSYMQIHKPYLSMACIDAQTQHKMDECSRKSHAALMKTMERTFAELKKNYKTSEAGLLKVLETSQASWQNYMISSCKLETYYSRNGTGYESILNGCLESKLNERISYLRWMLDNP